jgi:hypothetical protein
LAGLTILLYKKTIISVSIDEAVPVIMLTIMLAVFSVMVICFLHNKLIQIYKKSEQIKEYMEL